MTDHDERLAFEQISTTASRDRWNEESSLPSAPEVVASAPIRLREVVALALLIVLSDTAIYRSQGFCGPAVLFLISPLLLWLGMLRAKVDGSATVIGLMLLVVSLRLFWCGSDLAIAAGSVLLCCFAMSLVGLRPYLTRVVVFAAQLIPAGHRGLRLYFRSLARWDRLFTGSEWFEFGLPLATVIAFGTFFVMANPDLLKSFGENFVRLVDWFQYGFQQFDLIEILFCFGAAWISIGALRPYTEPSDAIEAVRPRFQEVAKSPLYAAFRNTLFVVIGLFAAYLVFEFQTLWFRSFPAKFHYSGYAHEGAAWLTVALGLSTILLSLIFSGSILCDPRSRSLRMLAWIWSIENLLLALSVFNRLFIYIGFNGMTRMRVVGILGVAAIVGGFLLVLRKIAMSYDFVWLIRRQLWTVGFAIYLLAVLPVDAFVNQYNVQRILAGQAAPSVQISVHPTSDEGLLFLSPLIDCADTTIRDGVRAMLAIRQTELTEQTVANQRRGWTTNQYASKRLTAHLQSLNLNEDRDRNVSQRDAALERFRQYAYQWY